MTAEKLALLEKLDFLIGDLKAAREMEYFDAGKVLAEEIAHTCSLLALLKHQQEMERAWAPKPHIKPITTKLSKFQ